MSPTKNLEITGDLLLLVEGKDEVNFFSALLELCVTDPRVRSKIQVIDAGGKYKFRNRFSAICEASRGKHDVKAIGIVRDADLSAKSAFESVADSVKYVGFDPPSNHGEYSDNTPSIGIFVSPDGLANGAIETLCRLSVEKTAVSKCIHNYLDCLEDNNSFLSNDRDKSFIHAYLAACADPVARVGEGALQGVWHFDSPAFAGISQFVRDLVAKLSSTP